ncbi:MAG TPA: hypothetical protein VFQ85_08400 [Mycobacteriales bacterium]|nr:hypothetical protein [Mycobacteriales bacterium]
MEYEVVAAVVAALLGAAPETVRPLREGGYSDTGRWSVTLPGGRTAFVKAEQPPRADGWGVAVERLVYATVDSPHLPALVAYEPGGGDVPRVLVTEDLSAAAWGAPVTAADAVALRQALTALGSVAAFPGLAEPAHVPAWADDPSPLVACGLVDAAWTVHVPVLAAAAVEADPAGDRLVHRDLWLQNWCRLPGRGAVVVDWAGASSGNPAAMLAMGEAGVRAAGGPGGHVLAAGHPEWAAWMAGLAAGWLAGPVPPIPRLLETMRREAVASLRWACDELALPYPVSSAEIASVGPWRP